MPPTVSVAAFVFGMVLILAAIVGKELKIAAIELPALSRGTRLIAGIAGVALLYIGLFDPLQPARPAPAPDVTATVAPTTEPDTPVPPSATVELPTPTSLATATEIVLTSTPTVQATSQSTATLPTATIDEVEYVHNVTDAQGNSAMRIDVSFTIKGAKGVPCQANAYFAFMDDSWVKARSSKYQTTSGYLTTGANFTPGYDDTDYTGDYRLQLFIPYEEFQLAPGKYELKFHIELFQLPDRFIASSNELTFEVDTNSIPALANTAEPALPTALSDATTTPAEFVAFSNARVVYDVTDSGTKQYGIDVFAAFTITGYRGKTCRAVAYFFDSDMKPLPDTNGQYKTDTSEVAATADFTPGFDPAAYSGASELRLFIPYDELHLSKGTHDMFVYVTIYELPSLQLIGQSSTVSFRVTQN